MKTNYFNELKQYKQDLIDAGVAEKFHRRYISTIMSLGTWLKPKTKLRNHRNHLHQTLLERVSVAEYDYEIYRDIGMMSWREAICGIGIGAILSVGSYFIGQEFVESARPALQADVTSFFQMLTTSFFCFGLAKGVRECISSHRTLLDCMSDNDGQNHVGDK